MDPNTTLANAEVILDGTNVTLNYEPFFRQGPEVFAPTDPVADGGTGNATEPSTFDLWWTPHTVPAFLILPFIFVLMSKNLEFFTKFNSFGSKYTRQTSQPGFMTSSLHLQGL